MCDPIKFNYDGTNQQSQYDLDIHNNKFFLNLYFSETEAKYTCGPGEMVGSVIPFKKSLIRCNLFDDKNIVIIKDDTITTITDISYKDRQYELTYFKIKPTHIFNIMFSYEEYSKTYRFDLYISPKSDTIYDMILVNTIKINSKTQPKIIIRNGKIYSQYDNTERFERTLRDFFYYDYFEYGSIKKCTPIIIDNLKKKIYSEEVCIQNSNGSLQNVVFEDNEMKYDKNMHTLKMKNSMLDFSTNRNILFDLYSYNCTKDIDEAGKIFGIKKMFVLYGAIGIIFLCCISLIIAIIMKGKKSSKKIEVISIKSFKKKKNKK
jgi:hypothetical protein